MRLWITVHYVFMALAATFVLQPNAASAQCPTAAVGAPGVPTWRLSLDRVQVQSARESGGDRPYFASLVFRSCFLGPGTSRVDLVERAPHDWVSKPEHRGGVRLRRGDHMSAGESLAIPDWMGRFEWGGMPLVAAPGGAVSGPPWIFGVAIISFDNNNTPPHVIRNIMNRLRENLLGVLRTEVEGGNVLAWRPGDWGRLQSAMTQGLGGFSEVFQLTIGSTFNPDKPTGIQLLTWYGTDSRLSVASPPATSWLNFPGGDRVQLGQQLGNPVPTPTPMTLGFLGSGAVYNVTARLERVGGERVTWQRINERRGAVSIAACGNGRLYALQRDGSIASTVGTLSSSAWSLHGRLVNAARIACAGTTLYYLTHDRELFDLRAPGEKEGVPAARRLGRPHAAAQLGAAVNGSVAMPWVLNDDSTLWHNTKAGVDGRWVRVGYPGSAARVAGAPGRVFVLNRDRTLWVSETGRDGSWRRIDHPRSAAEITATARGEREPAAVYALNDDGSLWRGNVMQ